MKKIFDFFVVAFLAVLILGCSNVFNDKWEEDSLKDENETVASSTLTVYSASSTTLSDYTKFWLSENKTQSYTFSVTSGNTYYIQYADYNSYSSIFSSSYSYSSCANGKFRVTNESGNEVSLKYSTESEVTVGGNGKSASLYYFTATSSGTYKISFRTTNSSSSSYSSYSGYIYFRIYSVSTSSGSGDLTVYSSVATSTSDFTQVSFSAYESSLSKTFYAESGYTYYVQSYTNTDGYYLNGLSTANASISITNPGGYSVSTTSYYVNIGSCIYFTPTVSGLYRINLNRSINISYSGVLLVILVTVSKLSHRQHLPVIQPIVLHQVLNINILNFMLLHIKLIILDGKTVMIKQTLRIIL